MEREYKDYLNDILESINDIDTLNLKFLINFNNKGKWNKE